MQYNVTPSMLNQFQRFLDAPLAAEEFWNIDRTTGEYKRTADEIALEEEKRLVDMINRTPQEPNAAADRGTALNEIIDCMVAKRKTKRDDIKICRHNNDAGELVGIEAKINDFDFVFDVALCRTLRDYYVGALMQHYCAATMPTKYGNVQLYGYLDYWVGDVVYDLKTTSRYDFGKFSKNWQRLVYPWAVVTSGEAVSVESFEFTAVELREVAGITTGKMYPEVYGYNHEQATAALNNIVCRFIEWLQFRRELITDRKVFGGENPAGYVGKPIEIELL